MDGGTTGIWQSKLPCSCGLEYLKKSGQKLMNRWNQASVKVEIAGDAQL